MKTIGANIRRFASLAPRAIARSRNRFSLFLLYLEALREGRNFDRMAGLSPGSSRDTWRDLIADIVSFPKYFRQMQNQLDSQKREYFASEPFLKVARATVPKEFSWSGSVSIEFADRDLPGEFEIYWKDGTITGTHTYSWMPGFGDSGFYEIRLPKPGKLRGRSRMGKVTSDDGSVFIDDINGVFEEGMPGPKSTRFSARSINVTYSDAPVSFVRYVYRGVKLRGAPDPSQYLEDDGHGNGSFQSIQDSFETVMFDRRSRVTQLTKSEHPEERFMAVTLRSPALTEAEEHLLWEVVSFVAGGRAQVYVAEEFDEAAVCVRRRYLGGVRFGPTSDPPFDLRFAGIDFDRGGWTQICDGFARVITEGYPLGIALHHLHDSNDGYYQVSIKNLLFCIHTLFERWADLNNVRRITRRKPFERSEGYLKACASQFFEGETLESVRDSIHYANQRTGAELQKLFYESFGVELTGTRLRALKRRNHLFHRGFIKHDPNNENELQELIDDTHVLRTLAHLAILKLAGYRGPLLDYETYETVFCG